MKKLLILLSFLLLNTVSAIQSQRDCWCDVQVDGNKIRTYNDCMSRGSSHEDCCTLIGGVYRCPG